MPEVLKILIAVLVIAALLYLTVSFYGILMGQYKLQQATLHLENIINKGNELENGGKADYLLTNPVGWKLMDFNKQNEKALCFCPEGVKILDTLQNYESCSKLGICSNSKKKIEIVLSDHVIYLIKGDGPKTLTIFAAADKITVRPYVVDPESDPMSEALKDLEGQGV
mgnify:FL=1